jgi:hypothetical protein
MADFIWGGSTPATASATTLTDQASLPTWYQEYLRGSINKASSLAGTPYTQYSSPRVAGFNADINQGFSTVRNGVGGWQPTMNQAASNLTQGGEYNKDYFQNNFMNPYMSSVYDDIARRSNQNLTEKILPQVNNTFTGGGQFGSSRNQEFTNRAIRDQQDTMTGQLATAGQAAWDSGQKVYADWGNKEIQSGVAMGNLAGQQQAAMLKDASALDTIGREQQQQTQANYDVAYQDFQNQQNWNKDQSAWLASIIRGYQAPPTQQANITSTFQPIQGQSPLASLAGGVLSGVAATQPQTKPTGYRCGGLASMKRKGRK